MKKILILALLLSAFSASSQITSSGRVYFEAGALQSFASPTIYVSPTYNPILEQVRCRLSISAPSSTDIVFETVVVISKATIDAKTGSGTGDTEKFFDAVNQCVKDYMEAIADNSAVTFTIL